MEVMTFAGRRDSEGALGRESVIRLLRLWERVREARSMGRSRDRSDKKIDLDRNYKC